jgi:eukaryotic-like serine/threonine-protein kinase
MSDEDQFREAERLFHTAMALRPECRAGFVQRECAGDETMRTWLLSLLSHAGSPTVGYTAPPLDGSEDGERMAWLDAAGTRIGPYNLLEQIGEGGFGAVYFAEQTEPIPRTVALKIIKPGMDSKHVLARFQRERQALALMNHPGIARVLDAGVTDPPGCRPYFVMELVTGTPITTYCDQHGLSLNQRLELFRDLCRAVQHAHQKGVVHRDLKPSNILVTIVDGRAVPKVIDFGIAKALRSEAGGPGERTVFTVQGQLIGTPEYMSPEQADGFVGSDDIDTRSDIYSLGVILYELLTGVLPFDREQLHSAGFSEIQRIIREVDPPKPSTRLMSEIRGRGSEINGHRAAADRAAVVRALRSDLDWVVMRCLEKDRSRRYETADALAQEIGRFLRNEPVIAGPPSTV